MCSFTVQCRIITIIKSGLQSHRATACVSCPIQFPHLSSYLCEDRIKMTRTVWDADLQQQQGHQLIHCTIYFLSVSALVLIHCLTSCCLEPLLLQPEQSASIMSLLQHRLQQAKASTLLLPNSLILSRSSPLLTRGEIT